MIQKFINHTLSNLGIPVRTGFLSRDGTHVFSKTWYGMYGAKSNCAPLVIVHGGPGGNSTSLVRTLKALSQDRQIIFYDQYGSGKSNLFNPQQEQNNPYKTEYFVDELRLVLKTLAPQGAHILGHSWGNVPLFEHLVDDGQCVSAVFSSPLLDSQIWMNDSKRLLLNMAMDERVLSRDKEAAIEMLNLNISHDFYMKEERTEKEDKHMARYGPALDAFYQKHCSGKQGALPKVPFLYRLGDFIVPAPDLPAKLGESYLEMWGPTELQCTGTLKEYTATARLSQIAHIPTLLTCGRDDTATPETVRKFATMIGKNTKVEIFENSAHWPHVSENEKYRHVLNEFFKQAE